MKLDYNLNLPKYRCHKVVGAARITRVRDEADGSAVLDLDSGLVFGSEAGWWNKVKPQVGGYLVQYEDGYVSYSPAEAFEAGYAPLEDAPTGVFVGIGDGLAQEPSLLDLTRGLNPDAAVAPMVPWPHYRTAKGRTCAAEVVEDVKTFDDGSLRIELRNGHTVVKGEWIGAYFPSRHGFLIDPLDGSGLGYLPPDEFHAVWGPVEDAPPPPKRSLASLETLDKVLAEEFTADEAEVIRQAAARRVLADKPVDPTPGEPAPTSWGGEPSPEERAEQVRVNATYRRRDALDLAVRSPVEATDADEVLIVARMFADWIEEGDPKAEGIAAEAVNDFIDKVEAGNAARSMAERDGLPTQEQNAAKLTEGLLTTEVRKFFLSHGIDGPRRAAKVANDQPFSTNALLGAIAQIIGYVEPDGNLPVDQT